MTVKELFFEQFTGELVGRELHPGNDRGNGGRCNDRIISCVLLAMTRCVGRASFVENQQSDYSSRLQSSGEPHTSFNGKWD